MFKLPRILQSQDEAPYPTPSPESLENVLADLQRYGSPNLFNHARDGSWSCNVEVNVSPVGAKFEVRSDHNHRTPIAAALVCRDRLRDALTKLGGQA